ncbi:hypothetical protein [Polaromonas sp.]|uniref:hypothetical protein n=1 Tax=Polaromonas sp. TaxID=1869339 RepID=UPI003BAC8835
MHKLLSGLEVLVCEGRADLLKRLSHALYPTGASVLRAGGLPVLMQDELEWQCLRVIAVSAVHTDDAALVVQRTWGRPVVWIADAPDVPAHVMPQPAQLLPFDFSAVQLRSLLARLAQKVRMQQAFAARASRLPVQKPFRRPLGSHLNGAGGPHL